MRNGKLWNREETILAMNLYCRISFGRQHSRAPEVIELAKAIGRTPGAVAMKLNNITSIDPEEEARGIKGLRGASNLDRVIWSEFHNNWEKMAVESESLWQEVVHKNKLDNNTNQEQELSEKPVLQSDLEESLPVMQTESHRLTKVRLAQSFFRQTVLAAYQGRCCVSGIPVPQLLIASHIMPWSDFPNHRINPSNGLCLSRLHDAAFDKGLICFDDKNILVVSKYLKDYLPNESLTMNFIEYEGHKFILPEKFLPDNSFLEYHREHIYRD